MKHPRAPVAQRRAEHLLAHAARKRGNVARIDAFPNPRATLPHVRAMLPKYPMLILFNYKIVWRNERFRHAVEQVILQNRARAEKWAAIVRAAAEQSLVQVFEAQYRSGERARGPMSSVEGAAAAKAGAHVYEAYPTIAQWV